MRSRTSRFAFNTFRWFREMCSDLLATEEHVDKVAQKLHKIAGRAHVLEMEAYGETKPRYTRLPGVREYPVDHNEL